MRLETGSIFRIHQHDIVSEGRLTIVRTDNVRGKHVMPKATNHLEGGLETGPVQKIRSYDHQTAGTSCPEELAKRVLQAGAPIRDQPVKKMQSPPHLILATPCRHFTQHTVREGHETDTVVIDQTHIGQCRREPPGEIKFFGFTDTHRLADVNEYVNRQICFFLEQAQNESVEPHVGAPVKIARIVTRRVGTVIGKHHAHAGPA